MKFTLLCEGMENPIMIDGAPLLSWRVQTDKPFLQKAFRVDVATSAEKLSDPDVFTRFEASGESCGVLCDAPLKSETRYFWRVTVWDENGGETTSGAAWFETALCRPSDWHASYIGMGSRYKSDWGVLLRTEQHVKPGVARAKAYICGLGYYELYINGQKVGDRMLDTAQTEYEQKVFYATYDVTGMLNAGDNAFGIMLGDGWYHQSQLMAGGGVYGNPCAIMQLNITYENGHTQEIVTDTSWKTFYSPVCRNNVYTGETYDARLEQPGWDMPGFDDLAWFDAELDQTSRGPLVSQLMQPIRVVKELSAVTLTQPQHGVYVFDLGENIAGLVRLKLWGVPGNEICMRFAECLDETGMLDVETSGVFHIRGVQTIRYIFDKTGEITYTPRFCYHGFRYVELTGAGGEVPQNAVTGLKMNTDLPQTGRFSCSMEVLNTLHTLLYNAFTSNAYGLPTDCPAREKCGWTGDANIISDTSMILWDTNQFWDKFIDDIRTSHAQYGMWQNIAPGKRGCLDTVPAWGCALILIPWYHYEAYGSPRILEKYFDEMLAWQTYMTQNTTGFIYNDHPYPLADWAAPYGYDSAEHFKQVSTAYYYFSTVVMAKTAALLGRSVLAEEFSALAPKIREKFISEFYDFSTHTYGTQTLNSFCHYVGLTPCGEEAAMAAWCNTDVINHGFHITCGHIGVRYIFKLLADFGYTDTLKKVLESDTYPSFGEQIKAGATTLWECFGTFRDQSYNHHFKGGYGIFLYEDVLGIKKQSPGYKTFTVKPNLAAIIPWARGSVDTVYGRIAVDYKLGSHFSITVPQNTQCEVFVPQPGGGFVRHELGGGSYAL